MLFFAALWAGGSHGSNQIHFLTLADVQAVDDGCQITPAFAIVPLALIFVFAKVLGVGANRKLDIWGAIGQRAFAGAVTHAAKQNDLVHALH